VSGLFLHSSIDFLRSEDLLAVGKRDAHPLSDRVRIFALERQNVSQKGFNTFVHGFFPAKLLPRRLNGVRLPWGNIHI
jgi:hypothetical protein